MVMQEIDVPRVGRKDVLTRVKAAGSPVLERVRSRSDARLRLIAGVTFTAAAQILSLARAALLNGASGVR
jgi:hypothetical protein